MFNTICILTASNALNNLTLAMNGFLDIALTLFAFTGCFAYWCFPCFACSTAKKFGECLCLPMLDGYGMIPPVALAMRSTMRQRYGIEVGTTVKMERGKV